MEVVDIAPIIIRPDDAAALGRFRELIEVGVAPLNLAQMLLLEIHMGRVGTEISDQPIDQSLDNLVAAHGPERTQSRLQTLQRIHGRRTEKTMVSVGLRNAYLRLYFRLETQLAYPVIHSKRKPGLILEIRIFSNCPRNRFALGGNLHAGKSIPPLFFLPAGMGAGRPAQGNHARIWCKLLTVDALRCFE
ncbi:MULTISPECIES: hypothetical protein [unclassified Ruegeria]|uniref:hypothetical protein n=1 Tax=unclassified Ruegeria TaxID=2625375 RepID=UPI001488E05F|nr:MULTISPECIES: hypothetical protein [unclassified Ruegeria]